MKRSIDFDTLVDYKDYMRKYFSGMAMQGMLSSSGCETTGLIQRIKNTFCAWDKARCHKTYGNAKEIAIMSIEYADALLAQLESPEKK